MNDGVPFHLLGDKFCASRDAAATAAAAYQLAVYQFPPFDDARLEAVLAYAAVCRFRGDWRRATELLGSEPVPEYVAGSAYPPAALAIAAERLSLDFELGRIAETQSGARTILSRALAAGDWPLIIAMHRQIGMLAEERGDYSLARDHLDRACHYAEDLLETSFLADRIRSYPARVALRADCPMALLLGDLPGVEQVELDPAGDADDAGLAGFPGGEVAGLLGLPGAGPVRAVAGEEAGQENLGQERGEGEVGLVRGKKPRRCLSRRPGRAGS